MSAFQFSRLEICARQPMSSGAILFATIAVLSLSDCITRIHLRRVPTKIADIVVIGISIIVTGLLSGHWLPNECHKHQSMNVHVLRLSVTKEHYVVVATAINLVLLYASRESVPSVI